MPMARQKRLHPVHTGTQSALLAPQQQRESHSSSAREGHARRCASARGAPSAREHIKRRDIVRMQQLSSEDLSRLQTALLLCQAQCHPTDESLRQFLLQNLNLHNLGEYASRKQQGPCQTLLALTDGRVTVGAECKTPCKLAPTIYLILSDYRDAQRGEASPALAQFYSNWRASTYTDMPKGAYMHGLASWVADQLPLQTLFSYLGEGYYVVLGGYGFGGLVAHALAVRLVINVRNEINMAKQMGINLSALAQTEGKVSSFAFGSPLMANAALAKALSDAGLAAGLHTLWRARDGSPKFLTLCGELATSVEGRQSAEQFQPPAGTAVPFGLKSAQLQLVQAFAAALSKELAEASGTRKRAHQAALMCAPLDVGSLTNLSQPDAAAAEPASAAEAERGSNSVAAGELKHSSSTLSDRPSPKPSAAAKTASGKGSLGAAAAAATAATRMAGGVKAVAGKGPASADKPAAAASPAEPKPASAAAPSVAGGWKAALRALVAKGSSLDAGSKCAPLGNFWLIEPSAAPKATPAASAASSKVSGAVAKSAAAVKAAMAGKAAAADGDGGGALVELAAVPAERVAATLAEGLGDGNAELLQTWEWSLEEMRKDLMEAFPWVMFRTAVNVDSDVLAREPMVRASKTLILE